MRIPTFSTATGHMALLVACRRYCCHIRCIGSRQFTSSAERMAAMGRVKAFTVGLAAADREFLVKLTTTGTHPARMIMRARVLLELDENAGPVPDRVVVADRVATSTNTVLAVAKRFA